MNETMLQTAQQCTKLTITANGSENTYRLNQDVFLVVQDGVAQLLDFSGGQFYSLDIVGTLIISLVLEQGVEAAISQVTQVYKDVTQERVRSDLTRLLQDLEHKNLILSDTGQGDCVTRLRRQLAATSTQLIDVAYFQILKAVAPVCHNLLKSSSSSHAPTHCSCELLLTLSWISLRLLGWTRTITLWQRWHKPDNSTGLLNTEIIQAVDEIIREVATRKLLLPMVCKERALVGYHILRAFNGLPAVLVVGIKHYPFQMHAWVECDGRVLTDDPAHCELFTPIAKYC